MTHPRDHILALAVQLRSDMTTLANVTCKVRVNGGTATTYTNVSSPAIAQNADCAFGYELNIAANTYADGDVVERTWLYSGTAYAYGSTGIGPDAVDGAHYSNARGDLLANLDAAVSSRATVAAVWAAVVDSSGVTTLLSRIASTLAITGGKVDVNDKTGFALTAAYDPAKTAAQAGDAMALTSGERTTLTAAIWGALTSGLATVGSIGKLLITNIDAAISSRSTYAGADTAGTTTLLSRLTPGRASNLDNLDAAMSTRLATAGYTAPDNADIATILADVAILLTRIPMNVWDELLAGHTTAGSAGKTLASSGAGADPWTTDLPGAYVGSEAGAILAAIKEKTDPIVSGQQVVVQAPVLDTGVVHLVKGDDYLAADARALNWTSDDWPDLTGATITLAVRNATESDFVGSAPDGSTAQIELASTDTDTLAVGKDRYALSAVLADGSEVTLATGTLIVSEYP